MRAKSLYPREVADISIDPRLICYEIKSSQVQISLWRLFFRAEAHLGKMNTPELFP